MVILAFFSYIQGFPKLYRKLTQHIQNLTNWKYEGNSEVKFFFNKVLQNKYQIFEKC